MGSVKEMVNPDAILGFDDFREKALSEMLNNGSNTEINHFLSLDCYDIRVDNYTSSYPLNYFEIKNVGELISTMLSSIYFNHFRAENIRVEFSSEELNKRFLESDCVFKNLRRDAELIGDIFSQKHNGKIIKIVLGRKIESLFISLTFEW